MTSSLSTDIDPNDGANCCIFCRKEIRRMELPLPFAGRIARPLPVCKCHIRIYEKELEKSERLKRKGDIQRTFAKSIMSDALRGATLDNFIVRPGTETALRKAKEFRENWQERQTGLLLFGPVGNGKSHLARGIEKAVDEDGWATLFLDWPQLVELAKATFNNNSRVSIADYVRGAIDADLLVLDEIGAGDLSNFEFKDILFPIINGRQGKKTIYTTNLDLQRLDVWFKQDKDGKPLDIDGRLIDRIIGSCEIVRNDGTSKRKEDAMQRRSAGA